MIKGTYEKYVLPKLLDTCCSTKPINYQREKIVPNASGTVLEIGIGSGLNIPFYNNYGGLDLNTLAKPLNHEMEINRTAAKFKPFCYFNE